ncbi:unnamed protein product, partial [Rotaria magnacalcarata]
LQEEYSKAYNDSGVTPEFHWAHNQYLIELVGVNSLLSKYQYHILPQLLQGMEQSQINVIDTVCQNLQLIASLIQNHHEQRHRSFASFVVTSTTTDPTEELENYICSIKESSGDSSATPAQIEFETFRPPSNKLTNSSHLQKTSAIHSEQLIVYAAPVIQSQVSSRCKETVERLKEIKKEKSTLLTQVNKTPSKQYLQQDAQQQSDKVVLNQLQSYMKRKHLLRLIELEESVLLAQQELLKSHRHSMSSIGESDQEAQKSNQKNMKGVWRDTFRTFKQSTTSSSGSGADSGRVVSYEKFLRRMII